VPAAAAATFQVKPLPAFTAQVPDGCVGEQTLLKALQTDNLTTIQEWRWEVDGRVFTGPILPYTFSQATAYPVRLWAVADNGCSSDTLKTISRIAKGFVTASDTTIMQNTPTLLRIQSNGTVVWSPPTGLSNSTVANPVATLLADQSYTIMATTSEGCTAGATMNVKVFTGPAIYVPTAFTPNGDGKNDVLLPVYVGIRELKRFAVFNRWGQVVFSTNNTGQGWDGKGTVGTYVWVVNAVNYLGQNVLQKGTVTIIR
jgi:gliding motility-associated-like protein